MKKILAVVLSAAMLLALGGCSGKDAKTIYQEAVKKNAELTSMDMDSTTSMTMSQGDQTLDITTDLAMKMEQANTDQMKYLATTKTVMSGQEIEANIFYTDGYYYVETMGEKVKYPMDLQQLMEQVDQSMNDVGLDADSMKELTAKKDGDNQILTFTADPAKMDAYVKDVLAGMGNATAGMEDTSLTINTVSGVYTINKEGYYIAIKIHMDMEVKVQDQSIHMIMDMDNTINNPGQPVTVTLPATDGYQEVDPTTMQAQ